MKHKLIELISKIKIKRYLVPGDCMSFPTVGANIHKDGFIQDYTANVDAFLAYVEEIRGHGLVPTMMADIYNSWYPPITEVPSLRRKQFSDIIVEIGEGNLTHLSVLRNFLIETATYNHNIQRRLNIMNLIHKIDEIELHPTKENISEAKYYHIFCREMNVASRYSVGDIVAEIKRGEFEKFLEMRRILELELARINNNVKFERLQSVRKNVVSEIKKRTDSMKQN